MAKMRDDDPSNRKQLIPHAVKEGPPSPSSETDATTCASTVQTVHTAALTIEEQRARLQNQTLQLSVASGATVGAVVLTAVPMQLLVGFAMFLAFFSALMNTVYQRARLEYDNAVVHGNGFGEALLPEGLLNMLTNVSFHDFMVNGTFMEDRQHFLLYFIPGLSAEQLGTYVNRLNPRHRQELQRPGLGNFLGPQFMRFLMGDGRTQERLRTERRSRSRSHRTRHLRQENVDDVVPRRLELPAVPEDDTRLEDDEEGNNEGRDLMNQYVRSWGSFTSATAATPRATSRGLTIETVSTSRSNDNGNEVVVEDDSTVSTTSTDEQEHDDASIDAGVIVDAVFGGMNAMSTRAMSMALQYFRRNSGLSSSNYLRTGLAVGGASLGIGLIGLWSGMWEAPRFSMPSASTFSSFQMPSLFQSSPSMSSTQSSMFLSSALSSGATAGMMLMAFGFPGGSTKDGLGKSPKKKQT